MTANASDFIVKKRIARVEAELQGRYPKFFDQGNILFKIQRGIACNQRTHISLKKHLSIFAQFEDA